MVFKNYLSSLYETSRAEPRPKVVNQRSAYFTYIKRANISSHKIIHISVRLESYNPNIFT